MSNSLLQIFEGTEIRIVKNKDGEFWWVAADVCKAIEIGNPSMALSRLEPDEAGINNIDTRSENGTVQGREMLCVSEAGLYSLIFTSHKPAAKRFKRWVLHEVIPSIRKTGSYRVPGQEPAIEEPTQAPSSLEHLRECVKLAVQLDNLKNQGLQSVLIQSMTEHLGGKADVSTAYTRPEPSRQQPTREPVILTDRARALGVNRGRIINGAGLGMYILKEGFTPATKDSGKKYPVNSYFPSEELDNAIRKYFGEEQLNVWGTK
jgi:prophage antirepressor-like protein